MKMFEFAPPPLPNYRQQLQNLTENRHRIWAMPGSSFPTFRNNAVEVPAKTPFSSHFCSFYLLQTKGWIWGVNGFNLAPRSLLTAPGCVRADPSLPDHPALLQCRNRSAFPSRQLNSDSWKRSGYYKGLNGKDALICWILVVFCCEKVMFLVCSTPPPSPLPTTIFDIKPLKLSQSFFCPIFPGMVSSP